MALLGPALFLLASAEALLPATLARPASVAPRPRIASPPRLMETTEDRIKAMVEGNKIFLFMKGSKLFPQCGFSNTAVQILNSYNVEYETFDVLADNAVRDGVKTYSNWPTIPQCYIEGEFVGGCDLLIEMYQSGELSEMVEKAAAS